MNQNGFSDPKSRKKKKHPHSQEFGSKQSFADSVWMHTEKMHDNGLFHEITVAESDVSMVQTAEIALSELEDHLEEMRELLAFAAQEEKHNRSLREADQQELEKMLDSIDEIAERTRYGEEKLLDGTHDIRGIASGADLELIEFGDNIPGSSVRGYPVVIHQTAKRCEIRGTRALTQDVIDRGEQLLLQEGLSQLRFTTRRGESPRAVCDRLREGLRDKRMPLDVVPNGQSMLHLRHKQYGSQYKFGAASLSPGVLSRESGRMMPACPGRDVAGFIEGEPCTGKGQLLMGNKDSEKIRGLKIKYTGEHEVNKPFEAGRLSVFQNAFRFETGLSGPSVIRLGLRNMHAQCLGRDIENASGFQSLKEVNLLNMKQAKDALLLTEKALKEVKDVRCKVELFNRENLKEHLHRLKDEHEKRMPSAAFPDDGGEARVMAEFTRDQIIRDTGKSTLAQAYQSPQTVHTLLK